MRQSQLIARAPTGHRVGECHQRAVLSDAQVRAMRHDRERRGMSLHRFEWSLDPGQEPLIGPSRDRYIISGESHGTKH